MTGASLRMLSPDDAVQLVIRATAHKQQLKQQAQPKKPRRQRKDNSARAKRYREKKKTELDSTLATVEKLRNEVRELRTLRQILMEKSVITPFATTGSPLRFVHAYFEVFRYGMQQPPGARGSEPPSKNICGARQVDFMRAMTLPDVQFGDAVGIAPAMAQWKVYSSIHDSLFLEFLSFRMDNNLANCMRVTTTGVLHMRYTRQTVSLLFPHALAHEALVAKLVGREVHMKYTDHWYFDDSAKVCRYELMPDMVQALFDVLGSLEDVAWLLSGGAVLPESAHVAPDTLARIELLDSDDASGNDDDAHVMNTQRSTDDYNEHSSSSGSPQPAAAMAIEYLLS